MPPCGQSTAVQRFGAVNRQLRSPLAGARVQFVVAQAVQRRNPSLEAQGTWRISDQNITMGDVSCNRKKQEI